MHESPPSPGGFVPEQCQGLPAYINAILHRILDAVMGVTTPVTPVTCC